MDRRPNALSEVWRINLNSQVKFKLEDAFYQGDVTPLTEQELKNYVNVDCTKPPSPYDLDTALVSFHTEDLRDIAKWNYDRGLVSVEFFQNVVNTTDKIKFWNCIKPEGIKLPFYELCSNNLDSLKQQIMNAPCEYLIVKPVLGTNSLGVVKGCRTHASELVERIQAAKSYFPQYKGFMITEAIGGETTPEEFAVNAIIIHGRVKAYSVHKKCLNSGPPLFRDFAIVSIKPTNTQNENLKVLLRKIVKGLNISFGVLQLEFLVDLKGNYVPIDVALRPDGGLMAESLFAMTGIDFRLAQCYAFSGMHSQLAAQIEPSKQMRTLKPYTAIGAFYALESSDIQVSNLICDINRKRFISNFIVDAYLRSESSTSVMYPSEHSAAFCVFGNTPDKALKNLLNAGAEYGFQIGSKWLPK